MSLQPNGCDNLANAVVPLPLHLPSLTLSSVCRLPKKSDGGSFPLDALDGITNVAFFIAYQMLKPNLRGPRSKIRVRDEKSIARLIGASLRNLDYSLYQFGISLLKMAFHVFVRSFIIFHTHAKHTRIHMCNFAIRVARMMVTLHISRGPITLIIFNDVIITRSRVHERSRAFDRANGSHGIFLVILIIARNARRRCYEIIARVKVNALFAAESASAFFPVFFVRDDTVIATLRSVIRLLRSTFRALDCNRCNNYMNNIAYNRAYHCPISLSLSNKVLKSFYGL